MKAFELSGFMTTDEANYHNAKKEELRSKDWQIEILRQELKNKSALLKMCGEALEAVESLIKESDGVYGLHLNGSPAPWDELRTGAYFEEWLLPFDKALAALREAGVM